MPFAWGGFPKSPQVSKRSMRSLVKPFGQVFYEQDYPEMHEVFKQAI